jgi:ribA/ribD-fused uncharacterized protein
MNPDIKNEVKYNFFWKEKCPESNFYQPANFVVDGLQFNSSEQYFMYKKAQHFGDESTMQKILLSTEPYKQKQLGRLVQGFDKKEWDKVCMRYMYEACYYKFSQNENLKEHLFKSLGMENVEASPFDDIWGIKLSANDFRAKDKSLWRGKNLLGKILDVVRDELYNNMPLNEKRYR